MKELISSNKKYHNGTLLYSKDVYKCDGRIIKFYKQSQITFDDFSNHFKKYQSITGLDCSWRFDNNETIFDIEELETIKDSNSVEKTLSIITEIRKMLSGLLPKLKENNFVVSDILFQNLGQSNGHLIFIDESKFKEEENIKKQLIHFAIGAWRMLEMSSYVDESNPDITLAVEHINKELYIFRVDLERLKL